MSHFVYYVTKRNKSYHNLLEEGFFQPNTRKYSYYFTLNIYFVYFDFVEFIKHSLWVFVQTLEYLQMRLSPTLANQRVVQFPQRHFPLCWVWEGNCWTMEGRKRWSHLRDATMNLRSLRNPRTKQQRASCSRWSIANLKTEFFLDSSWIKL